MTRKSNTKPPAMDNPMNESGLSVLVAFMRVRSSLVCRTHAHVAARMASCLLSCRLCNHGNRAESTQRTGSTHSSPLAHATADRQLVLLGHDCPARNGVLPRSPCQRGCVCTICQLECLGVSRRRATRIARNQQFCSVIVYVFRNAPNEQFCAVTVGLWKVCSAAEELQFVLPIGETELQVLVAAVAEHVRKGNTITDGLVVEGLCKSRVKFIRTLFRMQPVMRVVLEDPEFGFDPARMRPPWRQQLP